jgi:SAM-dependent methyltransferase
VQTAAAGWAEQLAAWTVPDDVLASAPEPPWGFLPGMFVAPAQPEDTPARRMALEWLGDGGSVLDVGCGGGTASLALVPPARALVGVDEQPTQLGHFAAACAERRVAVTTVEGTWPAVSSKVPSADVVVCHHVAYNVADLVAFVVALTGHAHAGVVLELGARHPLTYLRPLWRRFWGIERPTGPSATDALAVVRECGVEPRVERWRQPRTHLVSPEDGVRLARKRLCLPASRDDEIAAALAELPEPSHEIWALSWAGDV